MLRTEFFRTSKQGDSYAVYAVTTWERTETSFDLKVVGYVFGRPEKAGGPRWWDHKVGNVEPTGEDFVRAVYPTPKRSNALEALLEAL